MISNERPSPFGRRPYQSSQGYGAPKYNSQPRPPVNEDTLKTAEVQIERKFFVMTLKENPRGRFLRITEDVGGRRDTIIIPSTGLAEFKQIVDEMVKASEEIPLKDPPPPDPMA
ncbi:MAG TPA: RNA-binding protein [Verrucomicrobiae bacterium]